MCGMAAQAQGKSKDAIVFAVSEHDFGRIDERGKPVSHTFEFTNEGTVPLVVTRVVTSCKCTSAEAPKRPVQPGERGHVTVSYNPRKQSGQVYRVIEVLTSQGRAMITIKGTVVE